MERLGQHQRYEVQLVDRRMLAPNILEARFHRPPRLTFVPGQFMSVFAGDFQRDYTMVSSPSDPTLDFCIGLWPGGRFSEMIRGAKVGDLFRFAGPHGHFIFHRAPKPAVFVATGTGIAPFVAYCRGGAKPSLLLHGVRSPAHLVYDETLRAGSTRYCPCLSRLSETAQRPADAFAGRVTDYLRSALAAGAYDFYLCGRRDMIREATAIIDRRFDGSRLFVEPYD